MFRVDPAGARLLGASATTVTAVTVARTWPKRARLVDAGHQTRTPGDELFGVSCTLLASRTLTTYVDSGCCLSSHSSASTLCVLYLYLARLILVRIVSLLLFLLSRTHELSFLDSVYPLSLTMSSIMFVRLDVASHGISRWTTARLTISVAFARTSSVGHFRVFIPKRQRSLIFPQKCPRCIATISEFLRFYPLTVSYVPLVSIRWLNYCHAFWSFNGIVSRPSAFTLLVCGPLTSHWTLVATHSNPLLLSPNSQEFRAHVVDQFANPGVQSLD